MKPRTTNFHLFFITLILILSVSSLYSINLLSVRDPAQYGSKHGYIDKAVLVVEPHGGYVEQSLYLTYGDHNQFPGNDKIEVIHQFELPQGSVVNDLWLWIGDSVMQAVMYDTWTARAIYDSIVSVKRDPAFLSKKGSQYELHVYPLESGSTRRIKLNFISPTQWIAQNATAQLPFAMLKANNAESKPLTVLFRTQENIWGEPVIAEQPERPFTAFKDTLVYHFDNCLLPDISDLGHLTLKFSTDFQNGYFFRSNQVGDDLSYFQLGILPFSFFNLPSDTASRNCLIGLDLSGPTNNNVINLIPNLNLVLKSALREKDSFQLMVTGAKQMQRFTTSWLPASSANIENTLAEFGDSDLAADISVSRLKHVLYCDGHASLCWNFRGIEELATTEFQDDLVASRFRFKYADVIAAYDHGYETVLSDQQLEAVTVSLDTFFINGGRLLSFYDYNRVGKERLATHYIPGLTTKTKISGDLYRNPDGNFGIYFPESVFEHVVNILEYDPDPAVKIELKDQQGRPAVISKKIKNGLLVVSGIWAFQDDPAKKALLGVPLLGIQPVSSQFQLPQMLSEMQNFSQNADVDEAFLFSNSDTLFSKEDSPTWVKNYLAGFIAPVPPFNTINLLDGQGYLPPYVSEREVDYLGSGYLLKTLADATGGLHLENHLLSFDYIAGLLQPNSAPARDEFQMNVSGENGTNSLVELREVASVVNDPNKPIFFIGSTTNKLNLEFDLQASFVGDDSLRQRQLSFPIHHDSTRNDILPAMLGFENLKDLFAEASYDTAEIVRLAIKYNLLCDYTALLCLEPNDTLHFMKDPFDEGDLTEVADSEVTPDDSLSLDIFPNPFNIRTALDLKLPRPAAVEITIFNIQGQVVTELFQGDLPAGRKILYWNGENGNGQVVSTGIYFVFVKLVNRATQKSSRLVKRMLLIR